MHYGWVRFHISERDSWHTTQNNRVMVIDESNASGSGDNNFNGVLDEVLHIQYSMRKSVLLFKHRWYDINNNKSQRTHVELGYKAINTSFCRGTGYSCDADILSILFRRPTKW